jgi:predicted HicB family RNase H-like nuclease
MIRRNPNRDIVQKVIKKNSLNSKKETVQISIKLDKELHDALLVLSEALNISKNKLIEDILYESGIVQEIDENYVKIKN